ncbi:MAG: hypothetical protein ACOVSR_05175 [Bacteroidia bacterium]
MKNNKILDQSIFTFFSAILIIYIFTSCNNITNQNEPIIHVKTDSVFIYPTKNKTFNINKFTTTGKYYYLCKVWGVLNYHPLPENENIDLSNLQNLAGLDNKNFRQYLINLLKPVVVSYNAKQLLEKSADSLNNVYTLLNNNWLNDTIYLNEEITTKLKYLVLGIDGREIMPDVLNQSKEGVIQYNIPHDDFKEEFPNTNLRLLGLFHYWNLINYFYPYKNLIDKSWDEVLYFSINDFLFAKSQIDYDRAVLKLIANLNDGNSKVKETSILTRVYGNFVPNFRMKKVGSNYFICAIRSVDLDNYGLKIGDKLLAINGIPLGDLDDAISPFVAGGNAFSKQREINKLILVSKNEYNDLKIERNKTVFTKHVQYYDYGILAEFGRMQEKEWENKLSVVWYPNNVAYLNMNHLFDDNFLPNMHEVMRSSALILDLRGFHNAVVESKMLNYIVETENNSVSSIYPDVYNPGVLRYTKDKVHELVIDGKKYEHQIIIIVDETTQGLGEYIVKTLQFNNNVKVIGSTTAGTDGKVSYFVFPGNIGVEFNSTGVCYYNFEQTQRIGVKLDKLLNYQIDTTGKGEDLFLKEALQMLKLKP